MPEVKKDESGKAYISRCVKQVMAEGKTVGVSGHLPDYIGNGLNDYVPEGRQWQNQHKLRR